MPSLISCLVPTSPGRRCFWPIMFRCFQGQTCPDRKMVLIDEEGFPGSLPTGVEHLVVSPGTSIGQKLNIGIESTRSSFFHKWDDDDWYRSGFLETLIAPLLKTPSAVSLVDRHLVFLVRDWKLYVTPPGTLGGGSICFGREAWDRRHFPDRSLGEDLDFIVDRERLARITPDPLNYILVRHASNTWKSWSNGRSVECVAESTGTLLPGGPENLLSPDDLDFYRKLRANLPDDHPHLPPREQPGIGPAPSPVKTGCLRLWRRRRDASTCATMARNRVQT